MSETRRWIQHVATQAARDETAHADRLPWPGMTRDQYMVWATLRALAEDTADTDAMVEHLDRMRAAA